jgi:hypothetical protein
MGLTRCPTDLVRNALSLEGDLGLEPCHCPQPGQGFPEQRGSFLP